MFTSAKKQNQFAALNEREVEGRGKGERDRLAIGKKEITCPVRQPHHEDGLSDTQVYLPQAVGQSLMLSPAIL